MSIANEIQRIQGAKANIKKAIEDKGVIVGDGTIDTYAEKIGEISGGSEDYLQYAKAIKITSLNIFGIPEVTLNLDNATTLDEFCRITNVENANTTVEHLTINCPNLITLMTSFLQTEYNIKDETLKRVTLNVDTQNCTSFLHAFAYLTALEVIDGLPLNFSSVTTAVRQNFLASATSLVEMRVVANSIHLNFVCNACANLSNETIQSIIDGLADLTGGTAQTLTLHTTVGGKLTDEQKATITAKNWILAY